MPLLIVEPLPVVERLPDEPLPVEPLPDVEPLLVVPQPVEPLLMDPETGGAAAGRDRSPCVPQPLVPLPVVLLPVVSLPVELVTSGAVVLSRCAAARAAAARGAGEAGRCGLVRAGRTGGLSLGVPEAPPLVSCGDGEAAPEATPRRRKRRGS